jgi:small subunit ribosomal protein S16
MAVKIRLARRGMKKRPYYNIIVANSESPRDGKFIEKIGNYDPLLPSDDTNRIKINVEKAKKWLACGAQPTYVISKFFKKMNISVRSI